MGKRFAKICKKLFPNQSRASIAEQIGTSNEGRVRLFEQGSMPETDVLKRLDEMGYSIEWLLMNRGSMRKVNDSEHLGQASVYSHENAPNIATVVNEAPSLVIPEPAHRRHITSPNSFWSVRGKAAADDSGGTRVPDTDEFDDPISPPKGLTAVPVIGDSMVPVILNGQYVLIDANREGFEVDGGIVVASILEPEPQDERPEPLQGTYVKRCYRRENMYYFASANTFSPFSAYIDHCRIWPVLGVWFGGMGKPPEGF